MTKEDFIEKYEFKIQFNKENIQYLNYVLEQLKKFDNKVVNCKIKKAADKVDPTTQRITHLLLTDYNYWYFSSNKNCYQPKYRGGLAYIANDIAMINKSDFIEDNRLKYDKLKKLIEEKINYIEKRNIKYISMLNNLDITLRNLSELNEHASQILSLIPSGLKDEFVDLTMLGEKWFINIR